MFVTRLLWVTWFIVDADAVWVNRHHDRGAFCFSSWSDQCVRDQNIPPENRATDKNRVRRMKSRVVEMLRGSFSAVSMTTAGSGCFVSVQLSDRNDKYINVFLPKHTNRQRVKVPCRVLLSLHAVSVIWFKLSEKAETALWETTGMTGCVFLLATQPHRKTK